jgi:hypothetical protein
VRANSWQAGHWLLAAIVTATILAIPLAIPARAQTTGDRRREIETALDNYAEAKTGDQRAAIIEYLRQLDRKQMAAALIDHIIASGNGIEATLYNDLIEVFKPDGCNAILDRLQNTDDAVAKGKLIVALRHCAGPDIDGALEGCLGDKRPVPFAAHGPLPRRVCDLAYDELFLKLRTDPRYGLDPSPRMRGIITEATPIKTRDTLIARLRSKLPVKVPSPAPSVPPEITKPATAAIPAQ